MRSKRYKVHTLGQADLKWQLCITTFCSKAQAFPKQRIQKNKTRRYKPTSEGMKGAIIPPTRENMEQVPSPTFLKGIRKGEKISKFWGGGSVKALWDKGLIIINPKVGKHGFL